MASSDLAPSRTTPASPDVLARARILLADDQADVLQALRLLLKAEGCDAIGVEVLTGSIVSVVDEEGVRWRASSAPVDAPTERIAAQTVLWAAGVAASALAQSLGVELDRAGRVRAEPDLRVPGRPEIFVVGDVCFLQQEGRPLPGVAQVAKQEGAHAARNILRAIRQQPLEPFRYRNCGHLPPGPGVGGGRHRSAASLRVAGLGDVAVHPHFLADWFPQSHCGVLGMGLGLPDVSASSQIDYR